MLCGVKREKRLGIEPDEGRAPPLRKALRDAGISTDPYDRSHLILEGEAAKRAAEIVKRRTKSK